MFTGLVQHCVPVRSFHGDGYGGGRLGVTRPAWETALVLGESIAVCGVCLTLVDSTENTLYFDCGPETLLRTTLGQLHPGDRVNLERALRLGDALGGHLVTGHVDGVGKILAKDPHGEWIDLHLEIPREFDELLVVKGSLAVDGVSLTIVSCEPGRVSFMLIPHTLAVTTLGQKPVGSRVNLEFDLLAKHVRKLFQNLTIEL